MRRIFEEYQLTEVRVLMQFENTTNRSWWIVSCSTKK
jgi:hypothetical protein